MEFRDSRTQQRRVVGMDRACDLLDERVANFAVFIAHRRRIEDR